MPCVSLLCNWHFWMDIGIFVYKTIDPYFSSSQYPQWSLNISQTLFPSINMWIPIPLFHDLISIMVWNSPKLLYEIAIKLVSHIIALKLLYRKFLYKCVKITPPCSKFRQLYFNHFDLQAVLFHFCITYCALPF